MRKFGIGLILAVVVVGIVYYFSRVSPMPVGTATPAPQGGDWIALLDAEHLDKWSNITNDADIFDIEDGVLHIRGRITHYPSPIRYVGYADTFEDFELHVEFKVSRWGNSGVFLRTQAGRRGFEIQVEDDHGRPPNKNSSGALYDVVSPMFNMALPAGEWNSYDITLKGSELVVVMNGWKVLHTDLSQMTMPIGKYPPMAEWPSRGGLALQDHGTDTWYRNIMIRPI